MAREIPTNEARTVEVTVSSSKLFAFLEEVNKERNVILVQYEPLGANFKVTATYAIMDLALKLGAVSTKIQTLADEANKGTPLRALAS